VEQGCTKAGNDCCSIIGNQDRDATRGGPATLTNPVVQGIIAKEQGATIAHCAPACVLLL
jgi:hypothetical protein